eukprot:c5502_g2_i1 orf=74-268(+)
MGGNGQRDGERQFVGEVLKMVWIFPNFKWKFFYQAFISIVYLHFLAFPCHQHIFLALNSFTPSS